MLRAADLLYNVIVFDCWCDAMLPSFAFTYTAFYRKATHLPHLLQVLCHPAARGTVALLVRIATRTSYYINDMYVQPGQFPATELLSLPLPNLSGTPRDAPHSSAREMAPPIISPAPGVYGAAMRGHGGQLDRDPRRRSRHAGAGTPRGVSTRGYG